MDSLATMLATPTIGPALPIGDPLLEVRVLVPRPVAPPVLLPVLPKPEPEVPVPPEPIPPVPPDPEEGPVGEEGLPD